ncbi:MAG: NAD(P)H-hydrate dehydratase [Anaerofustis stercorihominis]|nr:NAD(P)H-hydrate dehydratase [Anaerofustis stercorihominis]
MNTDILQMNITEILPQRSLISHKGTYGRLMCVTGSAFYRGASVLSSSAALKSGAGVVCIASVEEAVSAAINYDPSMTCLPLEKNMSGCIAMGNWEKIINSSKDTKALLLGCGLGGDNDIKILVKEIVEKYEKTLILDADALNFIAQIGPDILKNTVSTAIVTPHVGELARLTGTTTEAVAENLEECAKTFSLAYSCITVLKSYKTVISDKNGELYILDKANPALATAGSGDVLAGLIAGLSVQGISPIHSAILGVYIHSLAGENAAKKYSIYSTTAKNILEEIPDVFLSLNR